MKVCTRCGEAKERSEFAACARAPDGLKWWCRECSREYQRGWIDANRETHRAYGRAHYAKHHKRPELPGRVCDHCGTSFKPWNVTQRFCDDRCSRSFHRRKSEAKKTPEERWNAGRRANYQKRRALKKAAPVGEPVVLDEIRARDNNRCGICGGRVNGKPWPDPLSASLDHMVPLSQGGAHDPTNVQLAHLRCNVRKGPRGGGEQLRIV